MKKRKKLIASFTAVVMAIAMMPSIAMAADTTTTTVTKSTSEALKTAFEAEEVSGAEYIANVGVDKITTTTDDNGKTTIGFTMESGAKLPYTNAAKKSGNIIAGNFVALNFDFSKMVTTTGEAAYIKGEVVNADENGEYQYSTDNRTIVTNGTAVTPTDILFPVNGKSPTIAVMKDSTTSKETIELDFSGLELEGVDDYVAQAVQPDTSALTIEKQDLSSFVNKNVTVTSTLKAKSNGSKKAKASFDGYVAYKSDVSDATAGLVKTDGNYVAFTVETGMLDKITNVKAENAAVTTADAKAGTMLCVQRVDSDMVGFSDEYSIRVNEGSASGKTVTVGNAEQTIDVDYSGLTLVTKGEADDAAAAAKQIQTFIPDPTNPDADKVEAAQAIYDSLTEGGKFQLQVMHEDAYKALTDAQEALNPTTEPTQKPTGNEGGTTSGIAVGSTATVNGVTYKVTGSKTVTFQKPKKNAKKATVPATVKIKGKTYKVTAIAANAFKNNKKVTKITVKGNNLTKIGKAAFKNCKKLKTVNMKKDKKLKSVGKQAFKGDKKLKKVDVPNAKKTVKKYKKLFKKAGLTSKCKVK